jgi:17beta-estradiol 17-dehydrogenase / very-long-chain 3-oxoacyl-CoA reductase
MSELATPYITVYSATKAFMSTFTKALDSGMRAEGIDVRVERMIFGDIDTPVHPMKQPLAVLGAAKAAKCVLDRVGSTGSWGSQPVETPYWFHGVPWWLCRIQPW